MRLALITAACAALSACGGNAGDAAPEGKIAAGEVLGGDISDDMLPLDTTRSVSPPGRSGPAEDDTAAGRRPREETEATLPEPEASGGPEPHVVAPPGVDPVDGPPAPPQ